MRKSMPFYDNIPKNPMDVIIKCFINQFDENGKDM